MDGELVVRARAGDRRAFPQLVRRYGRRVYRAAYGYLGNTSDAEDATQETFLRAYRSLERFDETRPFYPWLHRICRNLCINLRRSRRDTEELPVEELEADETASPETAFLRNEALGSLGRALERLTPAHRQIVLLKDFQHCTYAEIAGILSIPVGTVMSRLYNARRRLQAALIELEAEPANAPPGVSGPTGARHAAESPGFSTDIP